MAVYSSLLVSSYTCLKWLCLMLNCQIKEEDNYLGRVGIWLLRQDVFRIRTGCLEKKKTDTECKDIKLRRHDERDSQLH